MTVSITVDPDDLRAHADHARAIAARVEDIASSGGAPSDNAVGHAAIADAVADVRRASRERADTIAEQLEDAAGYLDGTAVSAELLDRLLSIF
ncbi:type VII secretion target [Euzebya rosea]|uniref:type VII secretion target n=1 Tax=Euzebya rosea TaxID=2052804 RepID=UPI000D3E4E5C|nr:type VII secretion target [Euzebya rosea]